MYKVLLLTKSQLSELPEVALLLHWTKPNQPFHTRRSLPLEANEAADGTVVVEVVEAEEGVVTRTLNPHPQGAGPVLSTLTFPLEISAGVGCILNMGKMHFSVLTHPHVLGKMFIRRNLQNNEK